VFLVFILIMFYIARMLYVKYLVVLIYVRGVVVFILYISCMCWFISEKFSKFFLVLGFFLIYLYDNGLYRKFSDVGEFM